MFVKPARPRRGLPRQRLGCGLRRRPAHQDVHRDQRPRTSRTIHHELGHNFYQRAYNKQPFLFRDSANDGFHEAIGDTIALSVTPEYLVKLGSSTRRLRQSKDIGLLLQARAGEGRVPALRPADRSVAVEGILRRDPAGANTTRRGGTCA